MTGAATTAAGVVVIALLILGTFLYKSLAWLLILTGSILLVASAVVVVRDPPGEQTLSLGTGAVGLGMIAAGVVMIVVLVRRFEFGFWDTIPFNTFPGY